MITDRAITRSEARFLRKRAWQTKRDSALYLPSLQDFRAISAERSHCQRTVRDLLAPITPPEDAPEALRNIRWSVLSIRLHNNARDLAHRKQVVREMATLVSHPAWASLPSVVQSLAMIDVQWCGKSAAAARADLDARIARQVAA